MPLSTLRICRSTSIAWRLGRLHSQGRSSRSDDRRHKPRACRLADRNPANHTFWPKINLTDAALASDPLPRTPRTIPYVPASALDYSGQRYITTCLSARGHVGPHAVGRSRQFRLRSNGDGQPTVYLYIPALAADVLICRCGSVFGLGSLLPRSCWPDGYRGWCAACCICGLATRPPAGSA